MYGGDWSIFLDKDWVFKLAPMPGFWRVLGCGWFKMFLDGDWLIVHGLVEKGNMPSERVILLVGDSR